jgi:hypothetical protein
MQQDQCNQTPATQPETLATERVAPTPAQVLVDPQRLDGLSMEASAIYLALVLDNALGRKSTGRSLRDRFGCGPHSVMHALVELRKRGLVLTGPEHFAAMRQWDVDLYGEDGALFGEQVRARATAKRRERPEPVVHPEPTEPTWVGKEWPIASPDYPRKGQNVVYLLIDSAGAVAYVGSTDRFLGRMSDHADDKVWTTWSAYLCANRDAAYAFERKKIAELQPYLNHQGSSR